MKNAFVLVLMSSFLLAWPCLAQADPSSTECINLSAEENHFWNSIDHELKNAPSNPGARRPKGSDWRNRQYSLSPRFRFTLDVLKGQNFRTWFSGASEGGPTSAHKVINQWAVAIDGLNEEDYQEQGGVPGVDFVLLKPTIRDLVQELSKLDPQPPFRLFMDRLDSDYLRFVGSFESIQNAGLKLNMLFLDLAEGEGADEVKYMRAERLAKFRTLIAATDFLKTWDEGGLGDWSLKDFYETEAEEGVFLTRHVYMTGMALDCQLIPRAEVVTEDLQLMTFMGNSRCCGDASRECCNSVTSHQCTMGPIKCDTPNDPCPF